MAPVEPRLNCTLSEAYVLALAKRAVTVVPFTTSAPSSDVAFARVDAEVSFTTTYVGGVSSSTHSVPS